MVAGVGPSIAHPLRQVGECARHLCTRWIDPIVAVTRLPQTVASYVTYLADWLRYASLPGSEPMRFRDSYPCLHDRTPSTPYDAHYFYQDIWAFKAIGRAGVECHVDVGSRSIFVGMLTGITKVIFIDIRPLKVDLENLDSRAGTLVDLPFEDRSVRSLSCLHVAEHVGLGRYGDPLDPKGTQKAARELARVLAPGGVLYFSVPVGRPRVCFNAHRIHSPAQILGYFEDLTLIECSGVDDRGRFRERIEPSELAGSSYACGFFELTRRE